MPVKNVWPPRSQSACSQVSTVLFYVQIVKFVRAQICVGDMCVSRLQAKGWQHHISQNIGLVIAGSARPASPALSERNECAKETVPLKLFKVQSLKTLTKKVGLPRSPHFPMAMTVCYIEAEEWQLFTVQCTVLALIYGTGPKNYINDRSTSIRMC